MIKATGAEDRRAGRQQALAGKVAALFTQHTQHTFLVTNPANPEWD